jgi:hypothetical protein
MTRLARGEGMAHEKRAPLWRTFVSAANTGVGSASGAGGQKSGNRVNSVTVTAERRGWLGLRGRLVRRRLKCAS